MKEKFIINDIIVYHPEQHRLTPLGNRGKETALNIPASRCLHLMLQRPGVNISKAEFFNEVWERNGQYVTSNTFYQNISLIRKGIRNAGIRNQVIRTLPKVGICFTGTVQVINDEDDKSIMPVQVVVEGASDNIEDEKGEPLKKQEKKCGFLESLLTSNNIQYYYQKNHKRMPFIIKLALVLIVVSFFIYRYIMFPVLNISDSTNFFGEHMHIFTVNNCDVLINRLDKDTTRGRFESFLESKKVSCNANEFLYITNSPLTIKKIIMQCQASANGSLECHTIHSMV